MNANTIVEELPHGYRWATELETERWSHPAYFSRMVQVYRGGPASDPFTDLAIREN
jgi:hypothetical protein